MQRYTDYVTNQNGAPVVGASILVLETGTQTPATLYSDDGVTPTANPLTTTALGRFFFYAADGRYDLKISGAGAPTQYVYDVLLEDPLDGSSAEFSDVVITNDLHVTGTVEFDNPLPEVSGGTGESSYSNGQLLIGNAANGLTKATLTAGAGVTIVNGDGSITISAPEVGTVTSVDLTAGTGVSVSGGPITSSGSITVTNTAPDQTVALTAGKGVSVTGTYPSFTVTNTAPDQTVALTQGGTVTVSGTYPNFTISGADQYVGTVTSIDAAGGTTGMSFSGGPVTGSGTLTLAGTLAVTNGGTGATTNTDARTNLDVYSKTEVNNRITTAEGNALAFAIALG